MEVTLYACVMVIMAKYTLIRFSEKHPDATIALMDWYDTVSEADWATISDIREQFNSVDYVGNERFVFNIRGNRYRLIVAVLFSIRTVYIKFVGTHTNYDRIDAKTVEFKP